MPTSQGTENSTASFSTCRSNGAFPAGLLGVAAAAATTLALCTALLGLTWATAVTLLAVVPLAALLALLGAVLTRSRSRTVRLAAALIVGGITGVAGAALTAWLKSPAQLFRQAVVDPAPASVRVVHGWESPKFSPEVWLHFTLSPVDLDALLRAGRFNEDPGCDPDFSRLHPPAWWNPRGLGEGYTVYSSGNGLHDAEGHRYIIVNRDRDEVFFLWLAFW